MGTFAPDLEYFIRLQSGGGWGHTFAGVFGLDLPLGLVTLWLFHRLVKVPLAYLLPDSMRTRLTGKLVPFRFGPPLRFLHVVFSMLVGIATHLIWDQFTHGYSWIAQQVGWIHRYYHLPVFGWWRGFAMLQIISSVVGLLIVAVWCVMWYRHAEPDPLMPANPFTPRHRHVIVAIGMAAAAAVAFIRAWINVGVPTNKMDASDFVSQIMVTAGALIWWQLAMWGLLGPFRRSHGAAAEEQTYMESRASLER